MKLELSYGTDAFCVPGAVLEKLSELTQTDLQVLLALCAQADLRTDQEEAVRQMCTLIHASADEIEKSVLTLRQAGFLTGGTVRTAKRIPMVKKPPETEHRNEPAVMPISIPEYTGEQIAQMVDAAPLYKVIIDETQKICGTMFNPTEISRVLSLADYLKLDFEHILMIFTYCKNRGKTSVQYIVKTAYTLYNEGIDTRAAFEEYVKKSEEFDIMTGKVRTLFGTGERAFTKKEKEMIADWCSREIPDELIERAYEITISNIGKASMAYTNKILLNWVDAGYRNLEDVQNALDTYKREKQTKMSFETDEFFEAALRRGSKKLGEA